MGLRRKVKHRVKKDDKTLKTEKQEDDIEWIEDEETKPKRRGRKRRKKNQEIDTKPASPGNENDPETRSSAFFDSRLQSFINVKSGQISAEEMCMTCGK